MSCAIFQLCLNFFFTCVGIVFFWPWFLEIGQIQVGCNCCWHIFPFLLLFNSCYHHLLLLFYCCLLLLLAKCKLSAFIIVVGTYFLRLNNKRYFPSGTFYWFPMDIQDNCLTTNSFTKRLPKIAVESFYKSCP